MNRSGTKTIIYCRVSTPEQATSPHYSLTYQENKCREFARNKGLTVVKVIKDTISAYSKNNIKDIQETILEENAQNIIFYDVSRYSRNVKRGLLNLYEDNSVNCYFVVENIDLTTPHGRHTFRIALSQAEYESDLKRDRCLANIQRLKDLGNYVGVAPYGFIKVKNKSGIYKLEKDTDQQNVIKFITEKVNKLNEKKNITRSKIMCSNIELHQLVNDLNKKFAEKCAIFTPKKVRYIYHKYCKKNNMRQILKRPANVSPNEQNKKTKIDNKLNIDIIKKTTNDTE
jgi:site-specific DNA recombinase